MTQSGQGEEPSARPAHEGIVLPSDGGEPLLPGTLNQPGGPAPVPPGAAIPASAPQGAQAWDQPWGPDRPTAPPADQPWQQQQPHQPHHPHQPQHSQQTSQPQQGPQTGPGGQGGQWGGAQPDPGPWTALTVPSAPPAQHPGPLPPEGAQTYGGNTYGGQAYGGEPAPYGGGPAPQGGGGASYGGPTPGPGAGPAYGGDGSAYGGGGPAYQAQGPYAAPGPQAPSAVQPPPLPSVHDHALPPVHPQGAALPPAQDAATQFLPPVQAGPGGAAAMPAGDEGATQFIPPVPAAPAGAGGDSAAAATQFLPPVGPGALPPEVPAGGGPAERPGETTTYLGTAPRQQPQGGGGPDAEATQFIAPVTDGGGPAGPPAEFAGLFRDEPGDSPAASTQQMPRIQQPQHGGPGGPAGPGPAAVSYDGSGGRGRRAGRDDGGRRGGRTGSKVPLFAAAGVAIAVVGVGAGALMSSGGGDDSAPKTVSATAPATDEESASPSASPSADPAQAQAVELDKLLADSGASRTAVINAVADVKACKNLAQAATDLRDAANQRTDLVTKLAALSVDRLPDQSALTTALTKAWQASASADNHYASWADQVAADKKSCSKGQAESTDQTQAGNEASGTATAEKEKAAALWNTIAGQYGLTERTPTQL
ncbi:hypothetical protein ACFRI7_14410 [Streptomyces sp. NPDC056716]|uniref:hypothetical protein n=1 Tax=unclassified Streptomyces TaxID=2593676 RepID=UPI0036C26CDF